MQLALTSWPHWEAVEGCPPKHIATLGSRHRVLGTFPAASAMQLSTAAPRGMVQGSMTRGSRAAFTISRLTSVWPWPREYRSRVTWWKWKCASVKQSALLYTTATRLAASGMPLPWLAVTWDCLVGRALLRDCPDADACLTPGFPSRTPNARNSALSFPGRQAPKAKRTRQCRRHAMEFKDSMLKTSGTGSPNRSRNRTHKRFDEQFRGMDMAPDLCNRRALRSNPSKVGFQRLRWRARNSNRSSMRSMYSRPCSSDRPPWASWRCRSSWGADTNGTLHCKQVTSPRTYQGRWLDRAWSTIFERFLPWRSNLQLGYGHLAKSTVPSAFWWRTPEDVPCGCADPASSSRGATSGTSSRDPDAGCWGSPWNPGSADWSLGSTEGPGNRLSSLGTVTECGDFSPRKVSRESWPSCSVPCKGGDGFCSVAAGLSPSNTSKSSSGGKGDNGRSA